MNTTFYVIHDTSKASRPRSVVGEYFVSTQERSGMETVASFKATDKVLDHVVWRKRLRHNTLRQRYRYYGMNYRRDPEMIWSRNVVDYRPIFKNLLGSGISSIPNNAGGELDQLRQTFELRSVEVFRGSATKSSGCSNCNSPTAKPVKRHSRWR